MKNMMQQAKKMQEKLMKAQDEISAKTVEGTAGGGMVKVLVNGKQEILSVEIEKEVVNPDDIEMLQDLIMAAVNEALFNSQKLMSDEMKKITGGMSIPGLM